MTIFDIKSISAFLYFGYLPKYSPKQLDSLCDWTEQESRKKLLFQKDLSFVIDEGVKILKRVFLDEITGTKSTLQIIPLSGGLDSRAILGAVLENLGPSCIHAVTFGVPGTWDFEIGCLVAKQANIKNTQIDLSHVSWDTDALTQYSNQCEFSIPLFEAFLFYQIHAQFEDKGCYWSGFMGDPLAGSHLLSEDSTSWEQAISRFSKRNRFSRSLDLSPIGFSAHKFLPYSAFIDPELLCYDEQLDFGIRQECYIKPLVLLKGYDYQTPFLHQDWVNFIMSVPRAYRRGQRLYKEILKKAYPHLFSLPVKNNLGLPLDAPAWRKYARRLSVKARALIGRCHSSLGWHIHPALNYIDFDRSLRERKDLKAVVYENIQDLKKRGVIDWLDMDAVWQQHQQQQANYADALTLLAALEINFKRFNSVHR